MAELRDHSDRRTVALVQQASGLEPTPNREALKTAIEGVEADLVVFPEAFARDFGSPDDDISAYAEALDGPFVQALEEVSTPERTVVAGMFEISADPQRLTSEERPVGKECVHTGRNR